MAPLFQFLIRIDHSVFRAIHSIAGKNPVLDWIVRVGADDHVVPVVLAILVIGTLLFARGHSGRDRAMRAIICAVAGALIAMIILFVLNGLFFRPRPFATLTVHHLLFYHNTDSSFPSNAATLGFALAFGVFMYWKRLGAIMIALAAFVSLARIAAGIHYPLDVIGGLLLGLGSVLAVRAAEPAYAPLARALNSALDRLLGSWKPSIRAEAEGGREP